MKLRDYLFQKNIKKKDFAKLIGVSYKRLFAIIHRCDLLVSMALKIEEITKGEVSVKDLDPLPDHLQNPSYTNKKAAHRKKRIPKSKS